MDSNAAARSAGYVRMRPVIMTATAMILGMLPMALALGQGGEQNAPLGRAVIGGLLFVTVSNLLFIPVVYSYRGKSRPLTIRSRSILRQTSKGNLRTHKHGPNGESRMTNIREESDQRVIAPIKTDVSIAIPAGKRRLIVAGTAVAAIVILGIGIVPRVERNQVLRRQKELEAISTPNVFVTPAQPLPEIVTIQLSGTMSPITEAPVLARVDGYLNNVWLDIGDHVHSGQVLESLPRRNSTSKLRRQPLWFNRASPL